MVRPLGTGALQAPTDVSLTSTPAGAALLSWRPPRRRPAGYRIYRAAGHDEPPAIIAVVKDPTITRYTDTDLTAGTVYEYTLTAYTLTLAGELRESTPTAPVVAAVLAEPPAPPTPAGPLPTLGPLPTFGPLPPQTLTAIAALPQPHDTFAAVPSPLPIGTPGGLAVATSVPVVSTPATSVPAVVTVPVQETAIATVSPAPTLAPAPTLLAPPLRHVGVPTKRP